MMRKRLDSIFDNVSEAASILAVISVAIALADYKVDERIEWNPYIAAILSFLAISECTKRLTILKRLDRNVVGLAESTTTVKVHGSRSEFYKVIRHRIASAKRSVFDTTWGPDVRAARGRGRYRARAAKLTNRIRYTEIYSLPSQARYEDLVETLRARSAAKDNSRVHVIHSSKVPVPDFVIIDDTTVLLGLPHVPGKDTNCYLEIDSPKIAEVFQRFLSESAEQSVLVRLQGNEVVTHQGGIPVKIEAAATV